MTKILSLLASAWKHKQTVINVVALVAATLTLWTSSDVIAQNPELAGVLGSILAGVNVILSYLTGKPVTETK